MIVGTAGHIDHGKTALVHALTGVNADRLKEERDRGITLDLGYAYQTLPDGSVLGFVDVPGHEKLIHNMLAGATGIDYVLLVVAADDGPMPQTREHVQILELLGLDRGAVVLTKCDLTDRQRLDAALGEIRDLLAQSRLGRAPVFPVSSVTGQGVETLREHLYRAAGETLERRADGLFRLAVDRCFTLSGAGTVVTGTVHAGTVHAGDTLCVSPSGTEVRVRAIHAQNQPADTGRAGQRCALNLAAPGLEKRDISRGDWVLSPMLHQPTSRLDARMRVLPAEDRPLKHWTPVHIHLGAARLMGRVAILEGDSIAPGASGLVQLVLEKDTHALHGDRFVLRDQSARRNIGGGAILDNQPPARGRRTPERIGLLHAYTLNDPAQALSDALPFAPRGLNLSAWMRLRNLDSDTASTLHERVSMRVVETQQGLRAFDPAHWNVLRARTLEMLADEHRRHPEQLGPDRERLRRLTAPAMERPAFGALLDELAAEHQVMLHAPWVHLPEHRVTLAPTEERLWIEVIRPMLDGAPYNPPRVREIAKSARIEEDRVRRLLRQLAGMGEVCRVAHDHYFSREAVADLAVIVRELSEAHGAALAAPFRDRIGTGRKVAIQILEFFDRIGYSRRIGDEHRVFQDSLLRLR